VTHTLAVSTQTLSLLNMKNLHIQHPEDSILTGDLSVLDAFADRMNNSYSVKIDGSPAIVWGVNPDNGKGTRLTKGRETQTVYRNIKLERDKKYIEKSDQMLFTTFDENNKNSGYYKYNYIEQWDRKIVPLRRM